MAQSPRSSGNMPNSSKKRKAAELDRSHHSPAPKSTKRRIKTKRRSTAAHDEIPFTTECPLQQGRDHDDAFVNTEDLADGFSFQFAVRPGADWKKMRSYKNVKYLDNTFSIGDVIYINRSSPPPKAPPDSASDEEVLAYDRKNFWVAKIADTRALSENAVYLRVFWLYWPEELPMGRQPYHTDNELVLSNAMDIVDAQTISSIAEVHHWDDSDVEARIPDRFWRQTFDIGQLGKDNKGGLSLLRAHCVCQQPYNPENNMYQCKDAQCATWNHEECLVKDAKLRVQILSRNDHLDLADIGKIKLEEAKDSLRFLSPLRDLGKFVQNKVLPAMSATPERKSTPEVNGRAEANESPSIKNSHVVDPKPRSQKMKSSKSTAGPQNQNQLKFRLSLLGFEGDEGPLMAKVEELSGGPNNKKKLEPTGKVWHISVDCLRCGKAMD